MNIKRDRPVQNDEFKVTPEMIEAGEQAIQEKLGFVFPPHYALPDKLLRDAAFAIYQRMKAAGG